MKILIVEDERDIREFVKKALEAESFVVDAVEDGRSALERIVHFPYDAVIIDLNLPGGMNGVEIAKQMRAKDVSSPIIALTVEAEVDLKVEMLKYADDYVTKPFSLKELIARVRSVLRRGKVISSDLLTVGDLKLDSKAYKVSRSGDDINLRNKEFALLEYFMRNPGVVLSRGKILEHVWDMNADPLTNTVDVHVRSLRKKIDEDHENKLIKTISGRGYKLEN